MGLSYTFSHLHWHGTRTHSLVQGGPHRPAPGPPQIPPSNSKAIPKQELRHLRHQALHIYVALQAGRHQQAAKQVGLLFGSTGELHPANAVRRIQKRVAQDRAARQVQKGMLQTLKRGATSPTCLCAKRA